MATGVVVGGGGSASGSDDCTASTYYIVKNKTAIANNTNDDPGNGLLDPVYISAEAKDASNNSIGSIPKSVVLKSYNQNVGSIVTNATIGEVTLNESKSEVSIPAGYYAGSGKVKINYFT